MVRGLEAEAVLATLVATDLAESSAPVGNEEFVWLTGYELPIACDAYADCLLLDKQLGHYWVVKVGGLRGHTRWFGPVDARDYRPGKGPTVQKP
jgi:hypothetical protein